MFFLRPKSGFTLIEVIISMAVLAVSFAAISGLLFYSIRANTANINRFMAYNLAQEGLEAIRNMRDSNWLSNFSWTGSKRYKASNYFEVDSSYCTPFDNRFFYRLSYNLNYDGQSQSEEKYNPWILECLDFDPNLASQEQLQEVVLYKNENILIHDIGCGSGCDDKSKSIFYRYLEVQFLPDGSPNDDTVRIESTLLWNEFGMQKHLSLDTILTNWKKGPL